MKQASNKLLMIKPKNFYYNEETAKDNLYQNNTDESRENIQKKALEEFKNLVQNLRNKGVTVEVLEDTTSPYTPDSIFPNNWFSTHNGVLNIYPMKVDNRREEVFKFKDKLIEIYNPSQIFDYSKYAYQNDIAFEGTGAMVLDRVNKIAYCSLSQRADKKLFEQIIQNLNFEPVTFTSYQLGKEVYHTNVVMTITSKLAIVSLDLIKDEVERKMLLNKLSQTHEVLELSAEQILNFAGNMLEVEGVESSLLAMSTTALNSLTDEQKVLIEKYHEIVATDISTIENLGGGSVRCMLAEIF